MVNRTFPIRLMAAALLTCALGSQAARAAASGEPVMRGEQLRHRLESALDQWCHWLAGYLYRIPGTDLYTLNPTLGTGANPYRDVAGNQFAAAAAGYWLARHDPPEEIERPLRGLIKLALGTHIAVNTVDRPDIQKWGATMSHADDWHADLFVVAQGMLMLDGLPPDQREQLRTMLGWEADKQTEYGISKKWRTWPGRSPDHSCGESNAWSAAEIEQARLAWPGDPRLPAWRETAILHSLNAICMPDDITSDEIVAGKPLRERVKGANFEPGGVQEHHGFYHPGYMGWTLAYQAFAHLMDQQLDPPQRNPDVYLHHWKQVFDRLKQGTFADGRFIYCAGYDWIAYGYGNTQLLPAAVFAAAHFKDPDATRLADRWLALIEQQQKLGGGSVQAARLAALQRFRLNDFAWYEGQEGCCLAQALWVLDRVNTDDIPQPSTESAYNERNTGTYYEPNARLVWCRDPRQWASFSWRAFRYQAQAIVQPVAAPYLLRFNRNGVGRIDVTGCEDRIAIESFKIGTFDGGGFWSLGCLGRGFKRVIHSRPNGQVFPMLRQHIALVAMPDGPCVFLDWCQAVDQLWLLRSGSLSLQLAADIFNNQQVRITCDGVERTFGQHPVHDTWHDLGARCVTIENQMTIGALSGEGTFHLMQTRARPPDRSAMVYEHDAFATDESLLSHELCFGPGAYDRPRIVSPGEWFRRAAFVIHCDPSRTPAAPSGTVAGEFPCVAVHLPDVPCVVAVNFGDAQASVDTPLGRVTLAPQTAQIVR
jgi:hypothetical protein